METLTREREIGAMKYDKGFTVLESLVAILILSIGILGVGTMLVTSLQSYRYNSSVRSAQVLAISKVEELRAKSADTHLNNVSDSGNDIPAGQNRYCRRWVVSNVDPTTNMTRVDVLVGWPMGGNCSSTQVDSCTYKTRSSGLIPQKP